MESQSTTRRRLIAAMSAGLVASRLSNVGLAQDATPSPAGPDAGSLGSMLALAYDPIPDGGTGPTSLFAYANIARQLEVRGLRTADSAFADDDRVSEWLDALDGLILDNVLLRRMMLAELWEQLGFDPTQVDQTMTIGDPPGITRIYRGRFDGQAIARALAAANYERIASDHGAILSSGAEGEISLSHPIQGVVLSAYNNVAVVEDAYFIASPFLANVEATLEIFAGNEATLANNRAVVTLNAAVGEELVSATMLDGSFLSARNMPSWLPEGIATPVPSGLIPPAPFVLFGITPGSMPSRSTDEDTRRQGDNGDTVPRLALVIALHLGSAQEAEAAVPIIEGRLADGSSLVSGQAYADLLGPSEVSAVPGAPVVKIRFTGDRVGRSWLRLVFARDLAFIYTE